MYKCDEQPANTIDLTQRTIDWVCEWLDDNRSSNLPSIILRFMIYAINSNAVVWCYSFSAEEFRDADCGEGHETGAGEHCAADVSGAEQSLVTHLWLEARAQLLRHSVRRPHRKHCAAHVHSCLQIIQIPETDCRQQQVTASEIVVGRALVEHCKTVLVSNMNTSRDRHWD